MASSNQRSKTAIIKEFVQNLASSVVVGDVNREIKALPDILWEGETPQMTTRGTRDGGFLNGSYGGLLVATDKRVIFLRKNLLGPSSVNDFAYSRITSVESKEGVVTGEITLHISVGRERIENIPNRDVRPFADLVRNGVLSPHGEVLNPHQVSLASAADELDKFAKLRDQGIISEEEFNFQKSRLLS